MLLIPATTAGVFFPFFSLGVIIGLVGLFAYRIATEEEPEPPERIDTQVQTQEVDVEAVQAEAWERIQPRLADADEDTRALTSQFIEDIERFFDDREAGSTAFAEAALGWRSKWELIKSREGHREFLSVKFQEYIFSQDELASVLESATAQYAQGMDTVENELLVSVRADLADLPEEALPEFTNGELLKSHFEQLFTDVVEDVVQELRIQIAVDLSSLVVGELIAHAVTKTLALVATRMGISTAVLGTGSISTMATVGAGLVIAIGVDFLLQWIIGWFDDPVGDISAEVSSSLEDVKTSIVSGDPVALAEYECLKKMAATDPEADIRDRAAGVVVLIERSGALGIADTLERVNRVHTLARESALSQLVFGK